MTSPLRIGLQSGAVAFVPTVCASAFFAACGPMAAVATGAAAGFLTGKNKETLKSEAARLGATAGAVSGVFVLVAQIIGVTITLVLSQMGDTAVPLPVDPAGQVEFYIGGLAIGFCFGGIGLLLAALAGAGVAYTTALKNPVYDTSKK
jgi:hypothetical protein